jgi:5'-methylthioadenosine phosphorylase
MAATLACIAGEEIHRQWRTGEYSGRRVGSRQTPFGPSGDVFLVDSVSPAFYLLARHGEGLAKTSPAKINYLANMYALKDLGVRAVLAWGAGGAISHNLAIGDLVILDDLIDKTHLRPRTFFEDSALGFLRQFPVFCPKLRRLAGQIMHDRGLVYHGARVAAVCEGPRLETPAEVRMLGALGAELVTHAFVPEAFLAKELQLCYAAVCYVVNYAETGSRHRPFAPGQLFAGLTENAENSRLTESIGQMFAVAGQVAGLLEGEGESCECPRSMRRAVERYGLSDDWRTWFSAAKPAGS